MPVAGDQIPILQVKKLRPNHLPWFHCQQGEDWDLNTRNTTIRPKLLTLRFQKQEELGRGIEVVSLSAWEGVRTGQEPSKVSDNRKSLWCEDSILKVLQLHFLSLTILNGIWGSFEFFWASCLVIIIIRLSLKASHFCHLSEQDLKALCKV